MKLHAFRLNRGQAPAPVDPEELGSDQAGAGSSPFWLDVEEAEPEELEQLLVRYGIDLLIRHLLRDDRRAPVAGGVEGQIVFRFPVRRLTSESEHTVALLLVKNGIVSVHDVGSRHMSDLIDAQIDTTGLTLDRPVAVATRIMHATVRLDLDVVTEFRARVDALATAERNDPGDPSLAELSDLRQQAESLTAVLEDQLYCLSAIPTLEAFAPEAADLAHLSEFQRHSLEHVTHVLERSTRRLEHVQDQRSLHSQDSTNRRLKVLTIVQAIFTPLTLIAGIWGMNFRNMPELDLPNAYFAALGLMGVVAAGSLAVFWRRGWFD